MTENNGLSTERLKEIILELEHSKSKEIELRNETTALLEAMSDLMSSQNESDVFNNLMNTFKRNLSFEDGLILVRQENTYKCQYSTKSEFLNLVWEIGETFKRVENGKSVCVYDVHQLPEWSKFATNPGASVVSTLSIPLKGIQYQAILMCTHFQIGFFSKRHLSMANKFIPLAAQGIKMLEIFRNLKNEVEQRKQNEESLKSMQSQLVKNAFQEGFAENAINVLHNIGNQVTPIKVGIQMLKNNPGISNVCQVLNKLVDYSKRAQEVDFFNKSVALLPEIVDELLKYENEKKEMFVEIDEKFSKIEDIISFQQKYVTLKNNKEKSVNILNIFNDIKKNLSSILESDMIQLKFHGLDDFDLKLDGEGLYYALYNIIQNSIEAVNERCKHEKIDYQKEIMVTNKMHEDQIELMIVDNGIGITAENLKELFQFGFSTKEGSMGFGLHSTANYLQSNKSSIKIESDGDKTGTTVRIFFPGFLKA